MFKGREEKLSGYIFDCGEARYAKKYATTIEEIYQFIRTSFTDAEHVVKAMKAGKVIKLPDRSERPTMKTVTDY